MPMLLRNFGESERFKWFDNIVFSLDVIFTLPERIGSVPKAKTIQHDLVHSTNWLNFERGNISQSQCVENLSKELDLSEHVILGFVQKLTQRGASKEILELASQLKTSHKVFVAGNNPVKRCTAQDGDNFGVFDDEYLSYSLGERLPHPRFFSRIISKNPNLEKRTIFVSNKADDIISARSSGFHAILVSDASDAVSRVSNLCANPIPKTLSYLSSNAKKHHLETNLGYVIQDNFASFLLLDATHDESLVYYSRDSQNFKWLYGGQVPFGLPDFPPDIDTNSIGHMNAENSTQEGRTAMLDKMLQFRDDGGLLLGYMDPAKIRLDPAMSANGLTFFHYEGRGHEVKETEDWLLAILRTRAFKDGTHYYPSPEIFLYYISRMLKLPNLPAATREAFTPILRDCIRERIGLDGDALALAFRVVVAARCGFCDNEDLERLLAMQLEDGSWGAGIVYQFVRYKGLAFHSGVTAAIALLAMREWTMVRAELE